MLTDAASTSSIDAATRELRATLDLIGELRRSRRLPEILRTHSTPGELADAVATWAEFSDADRLVVLRAVKLSDRVDAIHSWARNHLAELQVAQSIRDDVSEGVDKQQREWLLRQQLNSIRKELGEGDDDVVGDFRTKLDDLDAPDGVKTAVAKELDRFERMSAQSPEHAWVRTWLDRIFELPWGERSDDTLDLAAARARARRRPLRPDRREGPHRRVPRHPQAPPRPRHRPATAQRPSATGGSAALAARAPSSPSSGRPGSARPASASRSPGRWAASSSRVALGGVRDEAEIRGHRRTYVGSQPGRLVRALQEAGTMNPVILLDEVDKLAAGGWSGDPTAALLEVLDPAQNHTFRDHYLEVDLDLSEVVFIATANVADTIPAPLLDRMDLVRLDGYTDDEKVFIANRYLLPRQIERAGLLPDEVVVDDDDDHGDHPRLHPRGRCPFARTRARPAGAQGDRRRGTRAPTRRS